MNPALLAAYIAATAITGFGLHTDRTLRNEGGLSWGQIHALTDAGVIKPVAVVGTAVQYRLYFP